MQDNMNSLSIQVNSDLILDAGWWEESVCNGNIPCRIIHPPKQAMYDQVLQYLETESKDTKSPPRSELDFGEIALATMAVCIRWGSYFAVLADKAKPIWPGPQQEGISFIEDSEMARINIESSAALEQWIDLMRDDNKHYRKLVRAAAQLLPLSPAHVDTSLHRKFYRMVGTINSAKGRQDFINMLAKQGGAAWIERERSHVTANPTRVLANGLINTYWRNKSRLEDIHAGKSVALPLTWRRITPEQEHDLVRETTEWLVPSLHAVYNVINKPSEDNWPEQVLPFSFVFQPPQNWSLSECTREVVLFGEEPR